MKKRYLCVAVSAVMLLCTYPQPAGADEYLAEMTPEEVEVFEADVVEDEDASYEEDAEPEVYEAYDDPDETEEVPEGLFAEETEVVSAAAIPPQPTVWSHNGRITLVDGTLTDSLIFSFDDAAVVVGSVFAQLGGSASTRLNPWRTLIDSYGNRYYAFRQFCQDVPVQGGVVKLVTDRTGYMLGLTSSLVKDVPAAEEASGITAAQAQQLVLDHVSGENTEALSVLEAYTEKVILPADVLGEDQAEHPAGCYAWAVYTDGAGSRAAGPDLPYLVHYVSVSGKYLQCVSTTLPGDKALGSSFAGGYVFEYMEPAQYTGNVTLSTGGERQISVTLMRDRRNGTYYLGNIERRIVVADCYEFLYHDGRINLESSADNTGWDQTGLLSLYNYCRAYDYYKEIGWSGADGVDTPILILNNYCDAQRVPQDHAAYSGLMNGWQVFTASQANDASQCLDLLGHAFTHCVTGAVTADHTFRNDYGAIKEALCDIQGKTCQLMMEGADSLSWIMGDRGAEPSRSLENPQLFSQPASAWDLYYAPAVANPGMFNDMGGALTNSTLLSHVAYLLYTEGGMTLSQGRSFWFTVDCALAGGCDYPQLAELLVWALRASGLGQYDSVLRQAVEAARLGQEGVPSAFEPDRVLLTLSLPDTEAFADGRWTLQICSVNAARYGTAAQDGHRMRAMTVPEDVMLVLHHAQGAASRALETGPDDLVWQDGAWRRLAQAQGDPGADGASAQTAEEIAAGLYRSAAEGAPAPQVPESLIFHITPGAENQIPDTNLAGEQ